MKRVLLVDDEIAPLEGLRRPLNRSQSEWRMVFVDSGELAVAELEREPCDVVVADMRMPGRGGEEMLRIVSERWPHTTRIILSSYAAEQQIVRLVPLAHQYLCKPCEPDRLRQVIERCLKLQELLQEPHLRAVAGAVHQLPAIPRVYAELTQIMSSNAPTAAQVAAVVSRDTAIAAKVLHVVNSAFFGLGRSITKIEHAVAYLGFGAIRSLALSAEVFCQWPRSGTLAGFEPERLQTHVEAVAAGAYALARGSSWADDAMLAGLMHDIGYWVLLQQCPEKLSRAVAIGREQGRTVIDSELSVLGTTHAEIGAYLLGLWGLPYHIIEAVAFHHNPTRVRQQEFDALAALSVAHAICDAALPNALEGSSDGSPVIGDDYLSALNA